MSGYESGVLETSDGGAIPYIITGAGPLTVVMLPGESDGLRPLPQMPKYYARMLKQRAKHYTFIVISPRYPLPQDFGFEKHAEDMIWAVGKLGLGPAIWECTSAGGPIGQMVAVKRPELVRGMVFSSTLHRTGEQTRKVIEDWLTLIGEDRWEDFVWSTMIYSLTPNSLRRYRLTRPLFLRSNVPESPQRTRHMLQELLDLDHRLLLPDINCPCMVIGGQADRIVPTEIQREMAELITNCRVKLFPGYGHANGQENPAYTVEVDHFIKRVLD